MKAISRYADLIQFIVAKFPETLPARPGRPWIDAPNQNFDTVLAARSTYEVGLAAGITNAYPHLRHIVFSTTMRHRPDPAVELVTTNPAQRRAR